MAVKTKYGLQVDAWGALVMDRGNLAKDIEQLTIENLRDRELENLTITREVISLGGFVGPALEHVVVEQDLGGGGRATTLLRIVPRVKDLDLSWRLFERNVNTAQSWGVSQGTLVTVGSLLTAAGVLSVVLGVGLCLLAIGVPILGLGLGWWGVARKKTTAGTTDQFASRALANTVHWSLMKALASKGVANQHLQVLQQTAEPGLGRLMPTDLIDELTSIPKIGA